MDSNILNKLKGFVNLNDNLDPSELKETIRKDYDLNEIEKNLLYSWYFPKKLMDKELPEEIKKYRKYNNFERGFLEYNLGEISLLVRATRTPQYKRYMKHLILSYSNDSKIHPVMGHNECECGICKKTIYGIEKWTHLCSMNPSFGESERKEYLEFSVPTSNISLCLNCMIQLKELKVIMDNIFPDFLLFRRNSNKKP